MKIITIVYTAEFREEVEVPDDWEWDGDLSSLLEFTDMPFGNGELSDWEVR